MTSRHTKEPLPRNPVFDEVYVREDDLTQELADLLINLKIDPNNLDEEMTDHALLFGRWAILSEEAQSEVLFLKRKKELLMAELDKKIRREAAEEGRKTTENSVAQEIEAHDDIIQLNEDYLAADRSARILNVVRQSLIHRREMLSELARNRRHEWRGIEDA